MCCGGQGKQAQATDATLAPAKEAEEPVGGKELSAADKRKLEREEAATKREAEKKARCVATLLAGAGGAVVGDDRCG